MARKSYAKRSSGHLTFNDPLQLRLENMRSPKASKLDSLPKRSASFLEPMECASVSKLPASDQWVFEILCGPPHKISVAFAVMWRWHAGLVLKTHGTAAEAHIIP